jgi:hypothetical protein
MDDLTNSWDAKTMFEMLLQNQKTNREEARADTKEAREENLRLSKETNAKIDLMIQTFTNQMTGISSTLNTHVTDDAKNFKEQTKNATDNFQLLSDRIKGIEATDDATKEVTEKGTGHFHKVVGTIVGSVSVLILMWHYFIQVPQHEADMELQKAQQALSERQHQAPVQIQPGPAS